MTEILYLPGREGDRTKLRLQVLARSLSEGRISLLSVTIDGSR